MAYLAPPVLVVKMIEAGQAKVTMSTRDTLIRAYMAGSLLALAAAFSVSITVQTGHPIIGALLFPVGFSMLNLLGFDLLTGVFVLTPLAFLDGRDGVTLGGVIKNWALVFCGNLSGALTVAAMISVICTFCFSAAPDKMGVAITAIGEARTLGYAQFGAAGMITIFVRAVLCNWMVSIGVIGALMSTTVSGKVIAMWMPIMLFFAMGLEHSVVNMFIFPTALILGGNFSVLDYLVWNEIPTLIGNLVGGLVFTGFALFYTHRRASEIRL